MVPRGSTLALCLGGADFDGDLVSVIINNDVVDAIANGVYNKSNPFEGTYYYRRKLPAIKIPSTEGDEVLVPEHVPYQHIEDTFSNHIGRISNAAISIGQVEYDRNNSVESEFDANVPKVQREILEDLQSIFGSDFIVAVNFPKINTN